MAINDRSPLWRERTNVKIDYRPATAVTKEGCPTRNAVATIRVVPLKLSITPCSRALRVAALV
jgi:hypothetical protein